MQRRCVPDVSLLPVVPRILSPGASPLPRSPWPSSSPRSSARARLIALRRMVATKAYLALGAIALRHREA
eukprot:5149843-Pyramimonas_sp.AAC.1